MARRTTRRNFVKGATAAATAGFWVWNQRTYAETKSPNQKLSIAWIGVAGKGGSDSNHAATVGNLTAICDIDENNLGTKAEQFPEAEQFTDFREMLDKMGDKIDAVGISTPDHTHYPAAMLAMKKGKHVYCQKPLSHTVWESRQMRELAAKMKVKTQMGNQGSATDGLRRGVEWIRAGVIGPVKEIHVWTNRPIWNQAPGTIHAPAMDPPKKLHWDNWLGPAAERPYAEYEATGDGGNSKRSGKGAYHPFSWRGWWDFGTGALGDMACHTANLPFHATNLKYPTSVKAEAGDVNPETYPSWAKIVWEYPARDGMPPLKFNWYEGRMLGDLVLPDKADFPGVMFDRDKNKFPTGGALIVGEKGSLFQSDDYGAAWKLLPEEKFKDEKGPMPTIPRLANDHDLAMKTEWAAAIRGEIPQAFSNFNYAGVLTEAMLLGNVAIKHHGQQLNWDGEAMKFTNNEEANKALKIEPRKGWEVA